MWLTSTQQVGGWDFRLYDGSDLPRDEMARAGLLPLSGPPGLTVLYTFIYCGVIIFALFPFYIFFYVLGYNSLIS